MLDWNELFEVPSIIFVVGGVIAIVAIVVPQVIAAKRSAEERRLKQQMIQRGYSADEIERVVQATSGREDEDKRDESEEDSG